MRKSRRPAQNPVSIALQARFQQGLAQHKQGKLADAERIYEEILQRQPNHFDALHLLGVIARQTQRTERAVELIGKAIGLNAKVAGAHNNLGNAFRDLMRSEDALASYNRAIALKPDYAEAHINRGNALRDLRRLVDALASYDRAIVLKLDYAEAHYNRGVTLQDLKRHADAVLSYGRAIAFKPDYAEAHYNCGNALRDLGRLADALSSYDKSIALRPDYADAYGNRGLVLAELRRLEDAVASYDKGLALKSDSAEAYYNRGVALQDLNRQTEALLSYERAIAVKPDYAEAYSNRGLALADLGHLEDALVNFDRAIALKPDYADAYYNRGNALKDLTRHGEALASYDRAIALKPDYADAYNNRSFVRLLLGDFVGGWRDYLERDSMRQLVGFDVNRAPLPADLRGRRLLVLRDQGLGDEIFFLRFAAALKVRGATVFYRASEKLAAMITRSGAVDHVVGPDETPSELSGTVSVGDLPYLLGMSSVAEIPPSLRLPPLPEALKTMAARLRALGPKPYIGVTWRAGIKDAKKGLYKEAPRAAVAGALADVTGTLVALQRLPQDGEIEAFAREASRPVHDLSALNDSLEDILATLALIDDYVCVSNTNVHLRAGAGRSCRVLMPCPPDFRWMAEGRESPWFPGTRIYRQKPDGDWGTALASVREDLA